jgi:hypothetical protein
MSGAGWLLRAATTPWPKPPPFPAAPCPNPDAPTLYDPGGPTEVRLHEFERVVL